MMISQAWQVQCRMRVRRGRLFLRKENAFLKTFACAGAPRGFRSVRLTHDRESRAGMAGLLEMHARSPPRCQAKGLSTGGRPGGRPRGNARTRKNGPG